MIIIKPNCQYLPEEDGKDIEHIAKCAGICYGNDPFKESEIPIDYYKIYDNLLKQGHISPLRHSTIYYIIPNDGLYNNAIDFNPVYCNRYYDFNTKQLFVTINAQYYQDYNDSLNLFYSKYKVSKQNYIKAIQSLNNPNAKRYAFATLRYTFVLTTQISTSRELNRVSPNNICEQSTRYCKFTLPKFGEDVAICQPHWLYVCEEFSKDAKSEINYSSVQIIRNYDDRYYIKTSNGGLFELGEEYHITVKGIPQDDGSSTLYSTNFAEKYIKKCCDDALLYGEALRAGVAPQDARGLLPLDTATKVVYTYSYKEWQHILDLRLRGTTGKPHPNAKEVMKLLEPLLEQAHNSDKNEI